MENPNTALEYIAKGVMLFLPLGCDAPEPQNADASSGSDAEEAQCLANLFNPSNIRTEGEIISAENGIKAEVAALFDAGDGIGACLNFYAGEYAGENRLNDALYCSASQHADDCFIHFAVSNYGVNIESAVKDGDLYLTLHPQPDFDDDIKGPLDLFDLCKEQKGKNAEDCLEYVGRNKLGNEDSLTGKNGALVLYPKGEDNAAKYYLSQLEACKKMAGNILFDSDEPPFPSWEVALRHYVTTEKEILGYPVGGRFGKAFGGDYIVMYSPPLEAEELNSSELQENFPELFDGKCNDRMVLHELLHLLWHTDTGGAYYFWMALQEGAARRLELTSPVAVESKFETYVDEEFHEGDAYKFSEDVGDDIEEWLIFTVDKIEKEKIEVTVQYGSVFNGTYNEQEPDSFSYAPQSVDSFPIWLPEIGIADVLTDAAMIKGDDKKVRIRFISHLEEIGFMSHFILDCHEDTYDILFGHWIGGLFYTDPGIQPLSGETVEGNPYTSLESFQTIDYNSGACFYQKLSFPRKRESRALNLGEDLAPFFRKFTGSLYGYSGESLEFQYENPFCTLDEMQKIADTVDVKKIASAKFGYDDDDPWCLGL